MENRGGYGWRSCQEYNRIEWGNYPHHRVWCAEATASGSQVLVLGMPIGCGNSLVQTDQDQLPLSRFQNELKHLQVRMTHLWFPKMGNWEPFTYTCGTFRDNPGSCACHTVALRENGFQLFGLCRGFPLPGLRAVAKSAMGTRPRSLPALKIPEILVPKFKVVKTRAEEILPAPRWNPSPEKLHPQRQICETSNSPK